MLLGCGVTACAAGGDTVETQIQLSDSGVKVDGKAASTDTGSAVYVGGEIIYYQDGTDETYGEGTESDKHSAAEAEALAAILPMEDGTYCLTVAVVSGNETYAGVSQWEFTVGTLPFYDVRQGSADYDSIKAIYDAGLMEGVGGGRFDPNGTVTRAQAITVLARLARAEKKESDTFTDVAAGSWYSGYVGWASDNGIVEGDGRGHFLPEQEITGAHMELMLTRYAALTGEEHEASNTSDQPLTRAELARMLADLL